MKTNKDLYNSIKSKGYLDSTLTDGKPLTFLQKLLAKTYPIILCIFAIIIGNNIKKVLKSIRFWCYVMIGELVGLSWSITMTFYDPKYPGWLYHPWSIIGIDFGIVFEDIVFYIICGMLFFFIRQKIPNIGISKDWSKLLIFSGLMIFEGISLITFNFGGQSIILWFLIPGIIMLILSWKQWNLPRFFIMGAIINCLSIWWDTISSTIIPNIPGFSWASEWIYKSADKQGIWHHSNLWMNANICKWAWIGNVPIEIMFLFNISGWIFIYSLAQLIYDKTCSNKT
jgi:hypothetical protein